MDSLTIGSVSLVQKINETSIDIIGSFSRARRRARVLRRIVEGQMAISLHKIGNLSKVWQRK